MDLGTRSLARSTAAYLACVSFGVVYLLATFVGASGWTALLRAGIATTAVYFLGRLLFYPLADTILGAISDAERKRHEVDR